MDSSWQGPLSCRAMNSRGLGEGAGNGELQQPRNLLVQFKHADLKVQDWAIPRLAGQYAATPPCNASKLDVANVEKHWDVPEE